ncbi:MAG: hypothetical protein CM1200mP26_29300 [Acidimicrobiales bacterium]|nr:MAG: hypothetical protein CM1200mP26_29300 [Acidimicrobiales bacterium]
MPTRSGDPGPASASARPRDVTPPLRNQASGASTMVMVRPTTPLGQPAVGLETPRISGTPDVGVRSVARRV